MLLSERYREMRSRLGELRIHMLPKRFSPTGDYSDRQLDRARGYSLLAHAEIESYLEDISKDVVTNAIRKWKKERKPSSLIIAFLASYHSSWKGASDISKEQIIELAANRKNIKDSIDDVIDLAQTQFSNIVKSNHGIKEKNFKSLILPTGIDIDDLDNTWLTNLNNFGEFRGKIAHNTKRVTGQINPSDEYIKVKNLLLGLKDLDRRIIEIHLQLS